MSDTKNVLSEKKSPFRGDDFLFRHLIGISDEEDAAERAAIEIPPGRLFCVCLTIPGEDDCQPVKLYNYFRAEGVNTPLLFCRYMGGSILTVLECEGEEEIKALAKRIAAKTKIPLFGVYEYGLNGCDLFGAYDRLLGQLERVFYTESGETKFVRAIYEPCHRDFSCNVPLEAVAKGDVSAAQTYIDSLFKLIKCAQPRVRCIKKYLVRVYSEMLMQNLHHVSEEMLTATARIMAAKRLSEIKEIFYETAKRLAVLNIPENGETYSTLVKETIHIINENIDNEDLSLRWIAGNILYTNVDYLGKIFKKETGKNFSHYVMEKRMEAAKSRILEGESHKIYEVAESVGFGSNSQYFSQVFKKYTGVSPLEYREYAKKLRRKNADGK